MTTATLAMQRMNPRMAIVLALLLALAAVATILIAAFHGVPVHGHEAMSYDGKPGG